jgi:hypothetical protein
MHPPPTGAHAPSPSPAPTPRTGPHAVRESPTRCLCPPTQCTTEPTCRARAGTLFHFARPRCKSARTPHVPGTTARLSRCTHYARTATPARLADTVSFGATPMNARDERALACLDSAASQLLSHVRLTDERSVYERLVNGLQLFS